MLNIEKRYTFFVGAFHPYPKRGYRARKEVWHRTRGSRYLHFRGFALKAAQEARVPYFPHRLPLGLTVRARTKQRNVDPCHVVLTIVEALRFRVWIKPRFVAVHIRVIDVKEVRDEAVEVMISRMDL